MQLLLLLLLLYIYIYIYLYFINKHLKLVEDCRDGNGTGRVRRMGSSALPRKILSCPIPASPCMTEKIFLPHLHPLGPCEGPSHLVKFYFLLIFPTTSTIFLMKPISLIKIYLKLQLNLSHQIKLIFRKNWIIYPSV